MAHGGGRLGSADDLEKILAALAHTVDRAAEALHEVIHEVHVEREGAHGDDITNPGQQQRRPDAP